MKEPRRLYRSPTDRVIAGVCGGIGEYLGTDPVIVRLLAALLAFVNGFGVLLYIIFWIIVPKRAAESSLEHATARAHTGAHVHETAREFAKDVADGAAKVAHEVEAQASARGKRDLVALLVIVIGILLLANQLFTFYLLRFDVVLPVVLIGFGLYLMFRTNAHAPAHHERAH